MNGELADIICLATHGSAWLARGSNGQPPSLEASNSTFQYVSEVSFTLARRGLLRRPEETQGTAPWFDRRRAAGIQRLYLAVGGMPSSPYQHSVAAFANEGQWGLLAVGRGHAEYWRATWSLSDPDAPDQRIWSVRYDGQRVDGAVPQRVDLDDAADALRDQLKAAAEFAADQGLQNWVDWFHRALSARDIPYHPDMVPTGFDTSAWDLIAMAAEAWVFGGMGSWNDLGFEPGVQQRYEEVSRALYEAVLRAFIASVNEMQ